MRRFISFVILVGILSCQDTKTSKKTTSQEPEKKTINTEKDTIAVKEKTYPKGTLQNPMIGSQAELKPFLAQLSLIHI